MKRHTIAATAAIGAVLALIPSGPAAAQSGVFGNWRTQDGKAIVAVSHCGSMLCGKVRRVLAPDAPTRDVENHNPKLRDRPIEGLEVLSDFVRKGDEWHGTIYSPEDGRSYRAYLGLNDDGSLRVKGCLAIFCKTQTWHRAG